MDYTEEQYAVMEKLSKGLLFNELTAAEQDIVNYLSAHGVVQPRAQISDGYMELSQEGKRILYTCHEKMQSLQEQAKKEAQEHAEKKRQQRFENKMSVLNFVAPLITFVLGILVEHFARIVDLFWGLFGG